jgi:hypothetical protein
MHINGVDKHPLLNPQKSARHTHCRRVITNVIARDIEGAPWCWTHLDTLHLFLCVHLGHGTICQRLPLLAEALSTGVCLRGGRLGCSKRVS